MFKYAAFISYSHADQKDARWLHRALERFRLPRHVPAPPHITVGSRRGIGKVFRDLEELGSASSLTDVIRAALDESASLVVVCSATAAQSDWVRREIVYFRSRYPDRPVLPVLVRGAPPAVIPDALRFRVSAGEQITEEADEPLAVSLSEGGAAARLRLVAGVLGLPYDALRRRALRQRQRRLVALTAASVAAAAFSIGLATYALYQRDRAEREAGVALQVTDFLIDLFRSSDPFAQEGDVSVLEVLEQGAQRIERDRGLDPLVAARLRSTIGEAYLQLGHYEAAGRHLNEALATQRNLLDLDDPQRVRTEVRRAWLAVDSGQYEEAQRLYEALMPLRAPGETWLDVLPVRAEWAYALNDLGVLEWSLDNFEASREILEQALELTIDVHGADHPDVVTVLSNLGLTLQYKGEYADALVAYERSLAVIETLYGADHPSAIMVLANLASAERQQGNLQRAQTYLERALRITENNLDPRHQAVTTLLNQMGILSFRQGNHELALEQLERAGTRCVRDYGIGHGLCAANLQHQGRVHAADGNYHLARPLFERSIEAYTEVSGSDTPNVAGVYADLANTLVQLGEPTFARDLYIRALTILGERLPEDHVGLVRIREEFEHLKERSAPD